MKSNLLKYMDKARGFTLVELVVSLSLITIVMLVISNILFHGVVSYDFISENSLVIQEIQPTLVHLDKDIRQARKPNVATDSILRIAPGEIRVFCDITKDGKPEEIKYELKNKQLLRSYRVSSSNKYPYVYSGSFINSTILIQNISNQDIFGLPEKVTENSNPYAPPDYRRKILIKLEIENPNSRGGDIKLEKYLMSRSRVEAD